VQRAAAGLYKPQTMWCQIPQDHDLSVHNHVTNMPHSMGISLNSVHKENDCVRAPHSEDVKGHWTKIPHAFNFSSSEDSSVP
jgi:hypothetical protein